MTCTEQNFVSSQCLYGIMIAYPLMTEDEQITKACRMARKVIAKNYGFKNTRSNKRKS